MIRTVSSEFNRAQKELIILIVLFWSFLKTISEAGPMEKIAINISFFRRSIRYLSRLDQA